MGKKEVDECINKLRYVKKGDYVLTRDINDVNDCIKKIANWMVEHLISYNIDPEFVYELDPYIYKLRYVKSGDIIEPEDHNNIVDTLKKMRDVMERVEAETYNKGYQDGYSKGYQDALKGINVVNVVEAVATSGIVEKITAVVETVGSSAFAPDIIVDYTTEFIVS